jgi:hypothetical protein
VMSIDKPGQQIRLSQQGVYICHVETFEYENRSANEEAKFVPMGFPTDCYKTTQISNNRKNIVFDRRIPASFNFKFRVLVRGTESNVVYLTKYHH